MKTHHSARTPATVKLARPAASLTVLASVLHLALPLASAQLATQDFTLQPGWNALYLEVQPEVNSTASVFSNLPIASVWTRAERLSSVDFIQNPSEAAFNDPAWLHWFHPSRPEAFLGNLFTVQANRAYLIRSTNSGPTPWSVTGRPSLRVPEWVPDSYNLRGLPVDPLAPPTFFNFLRPSKAHYNSASGQLERVYRLHSASGQWQPVAPGDLVQRGAAYWIYTRGASDYLAPLTAKLELGDGLDFGFELIELSVRLMNRTTSPLNATLREIHAGGSGHLAYYQFNPTLGGQWPDLPAPFVISAAAGMETRLRLAVRRQAFSTTNYASVLEIRDGAGTQLLVPVSARRPDPGAESMSRAGLWIGAVTLQAVSEPRAANPFQPTPTRSKLNLTLMVHVDASGQARLLKQVTQMWRDGTFTNDGSGARLVDKPGQYVLLTDDTLLPFFRGATLRDGESVGRRFSTVGFDFPSTNNNFLNLTGPLAMGTTLTATLTLPFDHPTNPFKHKYHPDHDNLDASFAGPAMESFTTTRQIELTPSATPLNGPAAPDYGYHVIDGSYRETITGLHKSAIHVSGTFQLTRVSPIAELNPSPTP